MCAKSIEFFLLMKVAAFWLMSVKVYVACLPCVFIEKDTFIGFMNESIRVVNGRMERPKRG